MKPTENPKDPYYVDHASEHVMEEITYADGKTIKKGDTVIHRDRGYHAHVIGVVIRSQYSPLIRVQPFEADLGRVHRYPTEDGGVCMPCRDIGKPRGKWIFL